MAKRIPAVLVLALTACLAWQPAAMAQSSRNKVDIETRFKEAMADPKVADELYKVEGQEFSSVANIQTAYYAAPRNWYLTVRRNFF